MWKNPDIWRAFIDDSIIQLVCIRQETSKFDVNHSFQNIEFENKLTILPLLFN